MRYPAVGGAVLLVSGMVVALSSCGGASDGTADPGDMVTMDPVGEQFHAGWSKGVSRVCEGDLMANAAPFRGKAHVIAFVGPDEVGEYRHVALSTGEKWSKPQGDDISWVNVVACIEPAEVDHEAAVTCPNATGGYRLIPVTWKVSLVAAASGDMVGVGSERVVSDAPVCPEDADESVSDYRYVGPSDDALASRLGEMVSALGGAPAASPAGP